MKISELKAHFIKSLEDLYPSEEIQSFFTILSEKYLNLSRLELALNPQREVLASDAEIFHKAVLRLEKEEPIQYITGETEFFGLIFKVNEHTLIPRPETEELVDWVISQQNSNLNFDKEISILDIGTGSGCIAISLAKNLINSKVHALDISEGALKMARKNALENNVSVDFFQKDILDATSFSNSDESEKQYDIIVSNPPYIRELEKELMKANVLNYEPATALFVQNEDALLFYREISKFSKKHLKNDGILYFEINENFKGELVELLRAEGFRKVEVRQDIYGKDRMLKCSFQ